MEHFVKAAEILQTGEYQVLEQAYFNWHGAYAPEEDLNLLFARYMQFGVLPHWAEKFAINVISDFNSQIVVNPGFYSLSSFSPRVACAKKIPTFSIT
ncbi:MAG: hypothetical protein KDJ38_07295 [Gammaproteobacteria bacterium]|nr:hypothetical protein [Gammaproteobacteria bacterium]